MTAPNLPTEGSTSWYSYATWVDGVVREVDASTGPNLTESVQDIVGASLLPGSNASVDYDDTAGTITVGFTALGTEDMAPGAVIYVVQNSDGTWPNRPSPRTDLLCAWVRVVAGSGNPPQATAPDVGGAYPHDLAIGA